MKTITVLFHIKMNLRKLFITWFMITMIGSILLIASCALINSTVKENISKSVIKLEEETDQYRILYDSRYFQLDNWTEASILNFIYNNYEDSALKTAFAEKEGYALYHGRTAETALEGLSSIVNNEVQWEYIRSAYWLGGRTLLIALFHFMDYQQIRIILIGFGFFLFSLTVAIIAKRKNLMIAVLFTCAFLMINFQYALMNMSLGMFCFWIALIAIIYLSFSERNDYLYLLFVIGLLTQYFEWLALSIITFGLVTTYIVLLEWLKNKDILFTKLFNYVFNAAIGWILGFLSMFIGRLVISYAVIGKDAIGYIFDRVNDDVVSKGETSIFSSIINANLSCLKGIFPASITNLESKEIVIICIVVAAILLLSIIVCKNKRPIFLSCLLISLAPILWISVLSSYCVNHYWILFRVLCVTLCDVLFIMCEFVKSIYDFILKNNCGQLCKNVKGRD